MMRLWFQVTWWILKVIEFLATSLEYFVSQSSWYGKKENFKYEFPLQTYYCNPLSYLSPMYGQNNIIDNWIGQFYNFRLGHFLSLCNLHFCLQMYSHWAAPNFWSMATNLKTNNVDIARAAGLLDCDVQIDIAWTSMARIIPTNRLLGAFIHRHAHSIKYEFKRMVAHNINKHIFSFGSNPNPCQPGIWRFCIGHGGRNLLAA